MKIHKIVFLGPVGAGKTTAVRSATDNQSLMTDVPTSDVVARRKGQTTVAMDYGIVDIDDQTRLHVHGCPGQKRFDFMWPIITKGAYAMVLLIDNSRNYPKRDLKEYIASFQEPIMNTRLIIGITRTDISESPSLDTYEQWLQEIGINAEVMKVDPREKLDVLLLLGRLMTTDAGHVGIPLEGKSRNKFSDRKNGSTHRPEADMVKFDSSTLTEVNNIKGVTGATLTTSMGDLLSSTIDDDIVNEFIAFISGVTPTLESMVGLGKAERVMLKSNTEDSLTAFVGVKHILGVRSDHKLSLTILSQQVEDVVQWMDQ